MSQSHSQRGLMFVLVGGVITILSWITFYAIFGSGPTFPPSQFYTWPTAVIGGVIIGYGIAEFLSLDGGRFRKIGIALVGGTVAWTVQLAIQAFKSTAVVFDPSSVTGGLLLAAVVVSLNELRFRFKNRHLN